MSEMILELGSASELTRGIGLGFEDNFEVKGQVEYSGLPEDY